MDEAKTRIRAVAEVPWQQYPDHFGGALSKPLVEASLGARHLDYRISLYAPMAYVARHKHAVQEQIYHILEGEALFEYGDQRQVCRAHDVLFIPPEVEHAISNTGLGNLLFLVITSPLQDS